VVAIAAVALGKTAFGRRVLATGGNRTAAEFSGVDTSRIKFSVLLISGAAAGLVGLLYAGRLQSGRFEWGAGEELSAIAAVILGGTSLFGGSGTVVGTVVGALLIGVINNGLTLAGLESSQQLIVRGIIIIFAVALARRK
jgi:ribose transport system permease protein